MSADSTSAVHGTIEACIRRLFSNPAYVPLDPYKSVLFTLRRKERDQHPSRSSSSSSASDFPKLTVRSVTSSSIPLVRFGSSSAVGMKHLAKLISVVAVKRMASLLAAFREAMGSLPSVVQTNNSKSHFMETAAVTGCLSPNVGVVRSHVLENVVEAVVEAKSLDMALTVFIRRIVDEGFLAEKSKYIASAQIKVRISGRSQRVVVFRVQEIDSKRQQVLTVMKAAVVDSGEIYLELYMRAGRQLVPLEADGAHVQEPTTGFVKVLRRYHFSFIDGHTKSGRCFAQYPFETLARGLFFDMKEASMYRQVYASHVSRMKHADAEDKREQPMDNVLVKMCREAGSAMAAGEVVTAAGWLVQLAALLAPHEMTLSAQMMALSQLSSGPVGYLRVIRDAFSSLEALIAIVGESIDVHEGLLLAYYSTNGPHHPYSSPQQGQQPSDPSYADEHAYRETLDVVLHFSPQCIVTAEEDRAALQTLHALFSSICPAILEARSMLLGLLRDGGFASCELSHLKDSLLKQLLRLFNAADMVNPTIPTDPFLLSRKGGLLGVQPFLDEAIEPLHQICAYLHMLEASMAMDVVLELLEEEDGVVIRRKGEKDPAGGKKGKGGGLFGFGAKKQADDANARQEIPINMIPLNFTELLGYVQALCGRKELSSALHWSPLALHPYTKPHCIAASSKVYYQLPQHLSADLMRYGAEDRMLVASYDPSRPALPAGGAGGQGGGPAFSYQIWDIVAALNSNALARFGAVDVHTALLDERRRYDLPKFMVKDGIRIRYLMETHLYRVLHEGLVEAQMGSKLVGRYTSLCTELFKQSAQLQLFRVCDELLTHRIYAAHELNLVAVNPTNAARVSRLLIPGMNTPKDINNFQKQALQAAAGQKGKKKQAQQAATSGYLPLLFPDAGVFGVASVLYGLGGFVLPGGLSAGKEALAADADAPTAASASAADRPVGSMYPEESMTTRIYRGMWSLPPFIHKAPFSPSGVKLQVFSGLAIETAIKWGWQWDCSGSRFTPPSNAKPAATAAKEAADRDKNSAVEALESSDDEDDDGEKRRKKSSWFSSLAQEGDAKPSATAGAGGAGPPPPSSFFTSPYNDVGVLSYPGEVVLEVAYKAVYDIPDASDRVRQLFAAEVGRCCAALAKQPLWRVFDLVVTAPAPASASGGAGSHAQFASSGVAHSFLNGIDKRFPISTTGVATETDPTAAAMIKVKAPHCCSR